MEIGEDEESEKDDRGEGETLTRTTSSGKAYSMHFHPSYETMSWHKPHLDLNTSPDIAKSQRRQSIYLAQSSPHTIGCANLPTFSPSLLKVSRHPTLSEQLLCATHPSIQAYLKAQPGNFEKLTPDLNLERRKSITIKKYPFVKEQSMINITVSFLRTQSFQRPEVKFVLIFWILT